MADDVSQVNVGLEVHQLPADSAQATVKVRGSLEQLKLARDHLELGVDEGELVLEPGGGLLLALLPVCVHLALHLSQQVLLVFKLSQHQLKNQTMNSC